MTGAIGELGRRVARRHGSTSAAIAAYVLAGVIVASIWWSSYFLTTVNVSAILAITAIGWVLVFGLSGQFSLGHAIFFGLGGYVSAILATRAGWPVFPAMVAGTVAAAFLGIGLAIPLLRFRGLYLAIATLVLAIIGQGVATAWKSMTGGTSGLGGVPGWEIGPFSSLDPHSSFILVWTVLGLLWLVARMIWRSPIGRATAAAAEDESAAASLGIDVAVTRAKMFTVSAAYAGLSGALFAHYQNFIAPINVGLDESVNIVVRGIVGGVVAPAGGIVGAGILQALTSALQDFERFRPVVFGAVLVAAMVFFQGGVVGLLIRLTQLRERRRRRHERHVRPARATLGEVARTEAGSSTVVACEGVTKRFGGVAALTDVSFRVQRGEVYAIIGPNGAGKTTLVNAMSGFLRPDAGQLLILGRDRVGLRPDRVARLGVRRTFQSPHIVERLSVLDNIALGAHGGGRLRLVDATLIRPRGRRQEDHARGIAREWAEFFGVADDLDARPGELPAGHRRLVEVARAMAGRPALVLLDEPGAGLNGDELVDLAERLSMALRSSGTTAIVIDHQMSFIEQIADRVLVLDHGRFVAEDTPRRILEDPRVVGAYLGGTITPGESHAVAAGE